MKFETFYELYEHPYHIFESLNPFKFVQSSFSFLKLQTRLPSDAFQLVLTPNLKFSPFLWSGTRFALKVLKGGCARGGQNATED